MTATFHMEIVLTSNHPQRAEARIRSRIALLHVHHPDEKNILEELLLVLVLVLVLVLLLLLLWLRFLFHVLVFTIKFKVSRNSPFSWAFVGVSWESERWHPLWCQLLGDAHGLAIWRGHVWKSRPPNASESNCQTWRVLRLWKHHWFLVNTPSAFEEAEMQVLIQFIPFMWADEYNGTMVRGQPCLDVDKRSCVSGNYRELTLFQTFEYEALPRQSLAPLQRPWKWRAFTSFTCELFPWILSFWRLFFSLFRTASWDDFFRNLPVCCDPFVV